MAFCTECGHQLADGAKFCYECGTKVNEVAVPKAMERTAVYDGKIHKCPNCGEIIDAYDAVCKSCGYEIRGRKSTSVVHELSVKLEKTDDEQKKNELIRTFYIPNTKEDILEFFILALSQVKIGGMNTDAWMVKLEQAYQKAELSFYGTTEFERLKPMYEKAQLMNRKNSAVSFARSAAKIFKSGYTWAAILCVIGLFFLLINIGNNILVLNIIGGGAIYAAVFIAIFAFLANEDKKKKKKSAQRKISHSAVTAGKDAEDFLNEHYEDVEEHLKFQGFKNVVVKAEKKGLLDTEGAVKAVSISGNSEFGGDDEFGANSKVIIRYYSKNV